MSQLRPRKSQKSAAKGGSNIQIVPDALSSATVSVVPSIIEEIAGLSGSNVEVGIEEQIKLMATEEFDADLIIIGSGPGGYVAAIRAAQLGAKVICVEKEFLGGTCLNWGCIPSKAMIASVEQLHKAKTGDKFGVKITGTVEMDFPAMMARKEKIVTTQRGGVGMLFKKNKVTSVEGFAKFIDPHTIEVDNKGEKKVLKGKNFILAMGASAIRLPIPGLEGGREDGVWTSDDAVTAPFIPEKMVIVGGGAVGTEFSYVFNGLGTKVTLVESMPTLLPLMDVDLGTELAKQLGRSGVAVKTSASVEKCERKGKGWICHIQKGGETEAVEADVVLLGVGRKANTDGMNLEAIGVQLHRRGVSIVDDTLVTHVPHIYAIGDVTGRIQLAHVASAEGIVAVTNIIQGTNKTVDYRTVPNCVYTNPEVSSVGLTQSEAESQGFDIHVGKYGFMANGKSMAIAETAGFVKVVVDKKYGEILGVHMIGPHVTDLIHEAVTAIKLEATLETMVEMIHAHPTLSEVVHEAFEDAEGLSIHKL